MAACKPTQSPPKPGDKTQGVDAAALGTTHRSSHLPTAQLERYLQEERDFRSLAVEAFDGHQQTSQKQHQARIDQMIRRVYY